MGNIDVDALKVGDVVTATTSFDIIPMTILSFDRGMATCLLPDKTQLDFPMSILRLVEDEKRGRT